MLKILLLSDTHGFIDEKILKYCHQSDEVWHAGDIGSIKVTDSIKEITKLRAVYGNIDDRSIRTEFPMDNEFTVENVNVWITHIGGYPNHYNNRIKDKLKSHPPKIFISGHSHILKVQFDKKFDLLYLNPGAVGKYGMHKVRTMLRFEIDNSDLKNLEIIEIEKRI
jgi:putative phosphoesterase